jgi:beta-glucanase (GH16 family)
MKTILLLLLCFLNIVKAEELIWEEKFKDLSQWNVNEGMRNAAINCKEAVEIIDGKLHIKIFTKDGKHYTGVIDTKGKHYFQYGRIEIKAKIVDVAGTWTCAWLYDGDEIDVFEHRLYDMNRKDISGLVNHTLHWEDYKKCKATDATINKDEFNIYTLVWTKEEYKYYINGKLTWTTTTVIDKPLFFVLSTEIGYIESWTQPILKEYGATTLIVEYIKYYR